MGTAKTALVLGASGGIGGEVARKLVSHGWNVRALVRNLARAPMIDGVEWIEGDAMNKTQVMEAADGTAVIVHAVNPPGYRDWELLVLPMLENTIAAARAHKARVVLPGTLYNFGSGSEQPLNEASVQQASSRKGAIRVRMEARLREAAGAGMRVLIVRAGDFFGPRPGGNWFSQGLVSAGKPVHTITYPGASGVGHSWAYLPDLAEAMVRLIDMEKQFGGFEVFHFRGHWDADGSAMVDAIRRAAGNDGILVKRLPWWILGLLSPVVPLFREMREMRYLWQEPFALDNARLLRTLGSEPHTALDAAVAATLEGIGCVPAGGA